MPRSYADAYLPLWENALEEEIGFWIETNNVKALVPVLQEARRKSKNPALDALCLLSPVVEGKQVLFIAKKATEMPE